ncbi:S46 family peptidase, partial [bacterium]|nr:S46 family peptidase [bacterium]
MKKLQSTIISLLIITSSFTFADEGMYPLSEIHKLDLKAKGLEIELSDVYNPDGISLIDGICNISGCSGSFVSEKGLILTNHHCAYGAIKNASTAENDFLENGFYAQNLAEEVTAKGYTVRITESYRDVSEEVLSAIHKNMTLAERTKAIEKKTKEIITRVEAENPGKRASVSEMFIGKTYVLFVYNYLKDVRLVYAPPRSIGNFGGETDNWMWPRHTGDFSIMRAYVAPNGSPADYASENIPFTPKKVIKVAPEGVNEEDFVFILGYPGSTFRHRTSHFLDYEYNYRMPFVADLYEWQIRALEEISAENRDIALKHLSKIKGRSNTMKNYRGKLQGINRLNLIDKKIAEEQKLQDFINSDRKLKNEYGTILNEMSEIYEEMKLTAEYSFILSYLERSSEPLTFAYTLYEAAIELQKDDVERESAYMNRNLDMTKKRLFLIAQDYYAPSDKILFKNMLERAANLPLHQRISVIDELLYGNDVSHSELIINNSPLPRQVGISPQEETKWGEYIEKIDEFIENAYSKSQLADEAYLFELFGKTPEEIEAIDDPFIQLAVELYPLYQEQKEISKTRKGAIDQLYAKLIDVKKEFMGSEFIPDANGTLRLTYGNIRGYSPRDAVYSYPITTLDGVVEKTTSEFPFDSPDRLLKLHQQKQFGKFGHKQLGSVPVGILYNMDTTGGNSGSAVLNAKGELVGINFDRAYEATINDFAWSEDYSRSIAVDIRYVLWVLDIYSGASNLLNE